MAEGEDNAIKVFGALSDESAPNTLMACFRPKLLSQNSLRIPASLYGTREMGVEQRRGSKWQS